MPVDRALVDEARCRVASFEGDVIGSFHSVPWFFHLDNTVNAGSLWNGLWQVVGPNRIRVAIVLGRKR